MASTCFDLCGEMERSMETTKSRAAAFVRSVVQTIATEQQTSKTLRLHTLAEISPMGMEGEQTFANRKKLKLFHTYIDSDSKLAPI